MSTTPQDLILPVETLVPQTVEIGVTLKELCLTRADANSPGVMAVVLAPLDEAGAWRTDIAPLVVREVDNLDSENPLERFAASMFQKLMFASIVPNLPEFQALGVVGLTVWEAAKAILGQRLANNLAGATL